MLAAERHKLTMRWPSASRQRHSTGSKCCLHFATWKTNSQRYAYSKRKHSLPDVRSPRRNAALNFRRCVTSGVLLPISSVLTNQAIELTNERTAASLVTERIVASAQLQITLGGGWSSTQLPLN